MNHAYQGKKVVFGTDSERYLASLFQMRQEYQGSRYPDLMTDFTKKVYTPNLAIESKSGKHGGKLLAEQFVYAISTEAQYRKWFRESPKKLAGWLEGESPFSSDPYHLYYDNVIRSDDLKSPDIDRDFSAIKMRWGDQYLVPSNVLFAYFVSRMMQKDKVGIREAKRFLKDRTKMRIAGESSMSHLRRNQREFQNWEIFYSKALYEKVGTSTASTEQRKRVIDGVYRQIKDLDSYPRAKFAGPCGTHVHMIGAKEFPELITQVGDVVAERKDILTQIGEERKVAVSLLDKIMPSRGPSLFCNGGTSKYERKILRKDLTSEQISWLERLVSWKSEEDLVEEEKLPEKPKDEIPF
jgi:hypothetical protein